jgi:putative tricarboxylic transport membrane protein
MKGDVAASALCVAFFSFMFHEAVALHGVGRAGEAGSGFWPMLALGACVLLSAGWLVSTLRGRGAPAVEPAAEGSRRWRRVGLSVAALLAYIAVMPWIGFILSTLAFVPAFAVALGETRQRVLTASPVVVTALVVLVFGRFIAMPLPRGVGVFAALSRVFY